MAKNGKRKRHKKKDSHHEAMICPFCPRKSRASRFLASYKVIETAGGHLRFTCRACGRSFLRKVTSKYIIKEELLGVLNDANTKKYEIKRR